MPRLTEKSIVRPGDLFRELNVIRKQGFAVDDEEAEMGLRCVAAVVYNALSEPLAAISVSGLTSRVTDARLPGIGRVAREVAAELTAALGGERRWRKRPEPRLRPLKEISSGGKGPDIGISIHRCRVLFGECHAVRAPFAPSRRPD